MKYFRIYLLIILSILLYGCSTDDEEKEEPGPSPNPPTEIEGEVEILNASFESEIDFTSSTGSWKRTNFHKADAATVEWLPNGGYNNSGCIKLSSALLKDPLAVGVTQKLTGLKPGAMYRFVARIKTSDVTSGRGAVLYTLSNDQYWNASAFKTGTNLSWSTVYVDFMSDSEGKAEIVCGLGYRLGGTTNGGYTTGTVWYDDIKVYEITDQAYEIEGKNVKVQINKNHVFADEKLKKWVDNLDKIYDAYVDLIGDRPFGGDKLVVLSTPGIESGYWALAGNPVLWNENYVVNTLQQVEQYDDWVFGVMHELGHNFNGGSFRGKYNANWNWNDEIFANFRMYYAILQTDATVYLNGIVYKGVEIRDMYESGRPNYDDNNCYNNTIKIGKGNNGNGLMFVMIRLAEELGWDVYKKAFKELYSTNKSYSNNWAKFEALLKALQNYTDKDVYSLFPKGELDVIKSGLIN